jgi:two-component system phosphate regulon response regulator PhoB
MSGENREDLPSEAESPQLTPSEQRVLQVLQSKPGRAFTRAELCAAVMPDAVVLERTIDVHVKGLRKKLPSSVGTIETVRKQGYRFVPAK